MDYWCCPQVSICCVQVLDQMSTYLFHLHGASQTCPRLWRSAATFCSHQSLPTCPAPGGCLNSWSQVFPSCERTASLATPCDVLCLLCSFCPHLSDGGSAPQHVPPHGNGCHRPHPGVSLVLSLCQEHGLDRDMFHPGRLPQSCFWKEEKAQAELQAGAGWRALWEALATHLTGWSHSKGHSAKERASFPT